MKGAFETDARRLYFDFLPLIERDAREGILAQARFASELREVSPADYSARITPRALVPVAAATALA